MESRGSSSTATRFLLVRLGKIGNAASKWSLQLALDVVRRSHGVAQAIEKHGAEHTRSKLTAVAIITVRVFAGRMGSSDGTAASTTRASPGHCGWRWFP
jgi:hypothetical protein